MKSNTKPTEESGPKVPGYIVTFSDMVTLLLTFFVMLLSLAQTQDAGLFHKGQQSFIRALRNYGLGNLQGRDVVMDFGEYQVKYEVSEPDEFYTGRTVDAKNERMRRTVKKLTESMQTMPSQMADVKTNFSVTDIRFSPKSADLDESAKKYLADFCFDLQQNPGQKEVKLFVLGLAGEQIPDRDQWILSAKRAKAVSDFLEDRLSGHRWRFYHWGAGPGGDWVKDDSPLSKKSQIFIATLRSTEQQALSSYF